MGGTRWDAGLLGFFGADCVGVVKVLSGVLYAIFN